MDPHSERIIMYAEPFYPDTLTIERPVILNEHRTAAGIDAVISDI
jgi:hypothetical protein